MLPKTILFPLPKRIENIEDVKKWIENFNTYYVKMWDRLCNEFIEGERMIVVGNDNKIVHAFVSRKEDIE